MEHLDNDMDDLFQKAGELYPLKTTGSDWDAVAGRLQNEVPGEVHDLSGPTSVRAGGKRKWLLLLLLIPVGFGVDYFFSGQIKPATRNTISSQRSSIPEQPKVHIDAPDQPAESEDLTEGNKAANSGTPESVNNKYDLKSGSELSKSVNKNSATITARIKNTTSRKMGQTNRSSTVMSRFSGTALHDEKSNAEMNKEKSNTGMNETETSATGIPPVSGSAKETMIVPVPPPVAKADEAAAATKTSTTPDSVKKITDNPTATKKAASEQKSKGGFYVGLFAGPDLSVVKFQGVNQLGSSVGMTFGYRFNKRLSVETGLIWDQKYYYSSSEYFKSSASTYYPPNTTFNGHCDMFEIPLLLRYDFATDKNHGFFAKAGFSSYLMTHQYYSKKVDGVDQGSWPWKEQANYFFSIIQLSGGYEFSLNTKTKIQIEPYIKIPLRGLGEGNMPISSAGIYFGITRSFR